MENTNDTGKMIAALLIGAAIGGTLGILFAPAKGSETRKKIAGATGDFTDSLREKFEEFLEDAKKQLAPQIEKAAKAANNSQQ